MDKQRYPSVYLDVPLTMLRKGDGYTPKQHRGISVFVASYRLASGVWWQRILPALLKWIHPSAYGGLPGKECLEAAWEAQMDMEEAQLMGEENTEIDTDYEKNRIPSTQLSSETYLPTLAYLLSWPT